METNQNVQGHLANQTYKVKTSKEVVTIVEEEVEMTLADYIATRCSNFRETAGMSQTELSIKTNNTISPSSISRIEKLGNGMLPNVSTLEILAHTLEVHITDFFPSKTV